jgi:hypothetical protein
MSDEMLSIHNGARDLYDVSIELEPWFNAVSDHEIDPGEYQSDFDTDWDWDNDPDISEWLREYVNESGQIRTDEDETDWTERMRDNIYNNENDFSDCFTFTVYSPKSDEWYYGPAIIAVCFHRGGDPRNNAYDPPRFFYVENAVEAGFLDWVMGWYVVSEETDEPIDRSEEFSVGYSSYPSGHLDDAIDDPDEDSDDERTEWTKDDRGTDCVRARINGEWVRCYPDVRVDY